jgi:PilZ domain
VRLNVDRPVCVTGLDACPVRCTGTVRNLSGRGMRLTVPQAIPPGTAVRVDADNVMFLGEICYCVPEGSGYSVGLMLEHILTKLDELERLNQSLFGDPEVEGATSNAGISPPQASSRR